ncbi:MAG: hypothetical protein COB16_15140 [Rhodobacteraceae bacterium]|nr:MAG: hypothetical protein COB16_15140 [Paracoccaceae bacterium]
MRNILILITFGSLVSACNLIPDSTVSSGAILSAPDAVETVQLEDVAALPGNDVAPAFSGTASTVAGLGDPTVPGLWMETPLVSTEQMARVRSATGGAVTLTLRPIPGEVGTGSRLSIDAMRALGAPLTELVELQVTAAS